MAYKGMDKLETKKKFKSDPKTGRIDKDHHLAFITDTELKALNYLKDKDRARGFSSGSGPELSALASMDTGESLQYVNVDGRTVPSLNAAGSGSKVEKKEKKTTTTTAGPGQGGGTGGTPSGSSNNDNDNNNQPSYTIASDGSILRQQPDGSYKSEGGGGTPEPEPEKTTWDKIKDWWSENQEKAGTKNYEGVEVELDGGQIAYVNEVQTLDDGTLITRVYNEENDTFTVIASDGRDLSGINANESLSNQTSALNNTTSNADGSNPSTGPTISGTGNLKPMTAEQAIIKGGKMFAKSLGFSDEALEQAQADRADSVARMGGRRDYYGGVYDPETGQFTGGLEQKFYGEADRFDADYARQAGRAEELTAEGARLATDRGFYEGLQSDTQASQKALRDYRGRLDTMRDEVGREPTARRDSLYASRVEDIDNQVSGQKQQLSQMLAERGISPTSPVAIRMMREIEGGAGEMKRQARRNSLMDAINMQQSEMSKRSALIGQASGLTQQEMQAIGMRGNIRNQRLGALAGSAQQYAGLAGMSGARSDQMMTRGTFFGGRASDLNNTLLAEAMDRQYGEENKRTTGMQMALSKYGADKQAEIAQAMARANQSGNRRSLLGTIAGGTAGYLLSGGNPYMTMAGANAGGSLLNI